MGGVSIVAPEKLIMMANQIGAFFRAQGVEVAPAAIAEHLKKFWDPHMRSSLIAYHESGGAGLAPLVARAVELLGSKT